MTYNTVCVHLCTTMYLLALPIVLMHRGLFMSTHKELVYASVPYVLNILNKRYSEEKRHDLCRVYMPILFHNS